MMKLVIIGTICAVASAYTAVNPAIVNAVRTRTNKWVSHDVETNPLRNHSQQQLRALLGTIVAPISEAPLDTVEPTLIDTLPANFDWRTEKPECVHDIRD